MLLLKKYIYIFLVSLIYTNPAPQSEIELITTKYNNIEYVSLNEFIKKHDLQSIYYESKEKLEINFEGKKIYFSPFSSYCKIDEKVYHLTYSIIYKNNQLYAPIYPLYSLLKQANLPVQFINIEEGRAKVLTNIYNIKQFKVKRKKNGILLSLITTKPFPKQNIATSVNTSGWLNVTILDGLIDSLGIQRSFHDNEIVKVNSVQLSGTAQISFLLNKKTDDLSINTTPQSIDISIATNQSDNTKKIQQLRKKWIIDTIVIDPGHGGKDPGAIGVNNIQEKDITLDISKQLGKMIERNLGMRVIYTRQEDVFVPLWKRTQIANNSDADLFLSIHANASHPHSSTKGFETYLLRIGKTAAAVEVAKRENETIKLEEKNHQYIDFSDAKRIVASMTQNSAMKSSEFLAEAIQKNLSERIDSKDRGVKQAGFHVLVGATMPNALIEVGFVTNKQEAAQLKKSQYKREIAKGIFEAVLDFKNKYERK
tara:strand:- start:2347 stop:3792 length:1446 start_codon:yes stop_codon:yes gene_type:complete